jgi:hypothetical protein
MSAESFAFDDAHRHHPLVRVQSIVERLDLSAESCQGVKAALLHVLYGVGSDEALVDHLTYNVRFKAFVGPPADTWQILDYCEARDRAMAGGNSSASRHRLSGVGAVAEK